MFKYQSTNANNYNRILLNKDNNSRVVYPASFCKQAENYKDEYEWFEQVCEELDIEPEKYED